MCVRSATRTELLFSQQFDWQRGGRKQTNFKKNTERASNDTSEARRKVEWSREKFFWRCWLALPAAISSDVTQTFMMYCGVKRWQKTLIYCSIELSSNWWTLSAKAFNSRAEKKRREGNFSIKKDERDEMGRNQWLCSCETEQLRFGRKHWL